jgi:hypothetical protein
VKPGSADATPAAFKPVTWLGLDFIDGPTDMKWHSLHARWRQPLIGVVLQLLEAAAPDIIIGIRVDRHLFQWRQRDTPGA